MTESMVARPPAPRAQGRAGPASRGGRGGEGASSAGDPGRSSRGPGAARERGARFPRAVYHPRVPRVNVKRRRALGRPTAGSLAGRPSQGEGQAGGDERGVLPPGLARVDIELDAVAVGVVDVERTRDLV